MTEVYNLRIGDLIWNELEGANIIGLVYKTTPKYVYYAVCARNKGDQTGDLAHISEARDVHDEHNLALEHGELHFLAGVRPRNEFRERRHQKRRKK